MLELLRKLKKPAFGQWSPKDYRQT